ncbi:IclR family transcriptional regulator [Mycolicibacterium lutetiense]
MVLNTIDRTGKVLDLFTTETPEWGVTSVAARLQLPKSTTFDIMSSLAAIGLLQQTSGDRYRLGWRVLLISRRLMTSSCFNAHTNRRMAALAHQLSAVVTVGAWDGQGVVCIANASADRMDPIVTRGVHISGHTSALGKLLMAQLPWSAVEELIDRNGLPKLTEKSVTDVSILRAQLISVRRDDIAIENGETIPDQSCIAVGIHQRDRRPIAALSISAPTDRLLNRRDEYLRIARRTARSLVQNEMPPH